MIGMSKVSAPSGTGSRSGATSPPEAEHGEDVEQVAADDVADGDVALAADRGEHRGGHLRQ
jgi:hypothetical protein